MSGEAPPLTREYTIDTRFAARAGSVAAGQTLRTPWPWLGLATAALAGTLVLYGVSFMGWVAGFLVLVGVSIPLLAYFTMRRIAQRQFPPGTVLKIGFGDEFVSTQTPLESSTTAYSAYSGANRRGDIVLLRQRASKAWGIVPGQLFTDEDLARFPQD